MKPLYLVLALVLLIPAALSAAGNNAAPAAPVVSPASPTWLDGNTCEGKDALATASGLPDSPFAQRQEKAGTCPPEACETLCDSVCQCGGHPATTCRMTFTGTCSAICYCNVC